MCSLQIKRSSVYFPTGSPEKLQLFGVNLASETFTQDVSKDLHLGVIRGRHTCMLTQLRRDLTETVPDLPDTFTFLTADGCALLIHILAKYSSSVRKG